MEEIRRRKPRELHTLKRWGCWNPVLPLFMLLHRLRTSPFKRSVIDSNSPTRKGRRDGGGRRRSRERRRWGCHLWPCQESLNAVKGNESFVAIVDEIGKYHLITENWRALRRTFLWVTHVQQRECMNPDAHYYGKGHTKREKRKRMHES